MKKRFRLSALGLAFIAAAAGPLPRTGAAVLEWQGSTTGLTGGTNQTWDTNTTANWWDGAATVNWPAAGGTDDDAVFSGTAGTVTLATATANDLTFNTTGYTISGGTLTLNGTTPTLTNGTGISATIASKISGAAGLTKTGNGILTLSGANDYTGSTTVSAGTLKAGNAAALGNAADGTTIASGATLDVSAQNLGAEVVTISGTGVGGLGAIINTGAQQIQALRFVTLAGDATIGVANRWDIRANPSAILNLGGYTLTKTGAAYMGLVSTTVTNPGHLIINEGELNLSLATNLGGSAANTITVNNTGTLGMYQSASAHNWTLNLNTGSTLRGENSSAATQNIWAGSVNLSGNVNFKADATFSVTGNMSGTATIDKTGTGTLVLSGNNTHNGTTTITAGSLQIDNANALGAGTAITMSGLNNSSLVLGNSVAAGTGKTLTISGAGTGAAFGALSTSVGNGGTAEWQGNVTIGAETLTRVGTNAGNLRISGNIGESTAGSELWFRNNLAYSTIFLTGDNSFTGSPLIASGITSVASIGNGGVNSPLGQSGTIRLGLTNVGGGNLTYTGAGETTTKVIDLSSTTGNVVLDHSGAGLLKFSSNFTGTGAGPKTLTLQGDTTGTGEIGGAIVNGAGGSTPLSTAFASGATTITLASINGITVGAAISGTGIAPGTTVSAINTGTRVVTLSTAATGAGAAAQTITVTGVINPNSLTKSGSNTWVLSGTNTYTGGTTVNAGTLKLDYSTNNTSKLSDTTAGLTLGGGTLELAGGSHTEIVTSTALTTNTRSFITRSSGTSVLRLNTLTRNAGSSVDFAADNIAQIDNTNTNGILGGWATVGGNTWAVNSTNGADGLVTGLTTYTLTSAAGDTAANYLNGNISVDSSQTPGAVITPNSLRFNDANAHTLTLATGNNIVTTGGILVTPAVGSNVSTITGGTLTLPAAGTLTLQQNNSDGKLVVGSIVANNGTNALSLAKTGAGEVELTNAANTFTGSIAVNQGTLTLNGNLPARPTNTTVAIGNIPGMTGTLNIKGDLPMAGQDLGVGSGGPGAVGIVNHSSGTVSFTAGNALLLGRTSGGVSGTYNLSGGTLTTFASTTRGVMVGTNDGTSGNLINATFNLSGTGTLNNSTGLLQVVRGDAAASFQNASYSQTGGTSTNGYLVIGGGINGANTVNATQGANSTATVSITGGTFTTGQFNGLSRANNVSSTITIGGTADVTLPAFPTARGAGSTATLYLDGGTLKPAAASATYLGGLTNAYIQDGGARINTNSFDITVSQNLQADPASTGGGFTKEGAGKLTLTGSNSWTGPTTVNAGTLAINGNHAAATGATTVASGATLAGSGTLGGDLIVADSGIFAPGNSPGTLTTTGAATFGAASVLNYEFNGTNPTVGGDVNDLFTGITNLTLGGTLNVTETVAGSFLGASLGNSWRIFNYSGTLTGSMATGTLPSLADPGLSFAIDTSTANQVNLVVVPEASTGVLAGLTTALLTLRRRRR